MSIEADALAVAQRDMIKMRKAGCDLAAAAMHVITHYDGVHRLALAVAEWNRTIAGEGDRDKRHGAA